LIALLPALLACGAPEPEPPTAPTEQVAASAPVPGSSALPRPVLPKRTARTPVPLVSTPDIERVLQELRLVVQDHAVDAADPWALAHALLALGPDLALKSGVSVVDHLFSEFALASHVHDAALVRFPRTATRDGKAVKVEPHTDLLLKVLTEIGVRLDRSITVEGAEHRVGDLWQQSVLKTWLDSKTGESSFDSPNDMPWGLQGIAAHAPEGLAWTAEGRDMSLDDLSNLLVHVLTEESGELLTAMQTGGSFQKRGQGIFKYTCGGAHLLQGAAYVVARGFGDEAARKKLALQGPLAIFRLPAELGIYAELLARSPQHELVLMAQQLKFTGHWLESVHKMAAMGLFAPDPAQQEIMAQATQALIASVVALKAKGALDNLASIREKNPQLYLDLVGDSAHAIHGLELALGRVEVAF
jgi:hypothetical protein